MSSQKLETALKQTGVEYVSELYPGAAHGYSVADLSAYNKDTAESPCYLLRTWMNSINARRAAGSWRRPG
ncbi:dienelactone hydrolase family protein [Pyxidicoccus sp. 3LG]